MKANLKNRTIEMSKNEAKMAGRINSEKFNELQTYQNAYPSFTISIVETHKKKSQYSGLDYKFIENYINNCSRDDKNEILEKFNVLRGIDNKNKTKCEKYKVASYFEVKKWFLKTFTEIEDYKESQSKKIEEIMKSA